MSAGSGRSRSAGVAVFGLLALLAFVPVGGAAAGRARTVGPGTSAPQEGAPAWERLVSTAIPAGEIRAVLVDDDGALWLGARGAGVVRLAGERVDRFTTDDGLVSDGVADLHQDRDGRIWAAGPGGVSVYTDRRWTAHPRIAGMTPRVVFSIHEEPGGTIWLAANGGAARRLDDGWTLLTEADGLPHRVVHAVAVDATGVAWIGCRRGLVRLAGGDLEVLLGERNIRSIVAGPDGRVWVGTSADGIHEWDGRAWNRHLPGRGAHPRLVASDGSVWASSDGEGIFQWIRGSWRRHTTETGLPDDQVWDLAEGPDGSLWAATAGGVARHRPPRRLPAVR